jgi:hypothetical protein
MNKLIISKIRNKFFSFLPSNVLIQLLKFFNQQNDITNLLGYSCKRQSYLNPYLSITDVDLIDDTMIRPVVDLLPKINEIENVIKKISHFTSEIEEWFDAKGAVPWENSFCSYDSILLHCFIRYLKPKNYIEIGCGSTSIISSSALAMNEAEGYPCIAKYIEPYPSKTLLDSKLHGELIVEKLEDVSPNIFNSLHENDILFIDSSHVLRPGSDVEHEYLNIIPNLHAGVVVHVHDIFTPYYYPKEWLIGEFGGFNEQFCLELLLKHKKRYKILVPNYFLFKNYIRTLSILRNSCSGRPASFWF